MPEENKSAEQLSQEQKNRAIEDGIRKVIAEKKPQDPLIGLKMGAQEINQRLIAMLKNEKGVHIESFLAILGSLAGFSCQIALRGGKPDGMPLAPVTEVKGQNGRTYYMGDPLNKMVAEGKNSIWSFAATAAERAGCKQLPDVVEIFKHVTSTLGGDQFGQPRYPEGHGANWDTPENWVRQLWPRTAMILPVFCDDPADWPTLFSIAAHGAIMMGKDVIDPGLALTIIMETAIPMSKVAPMEVLQPPKAA